MAITCKNCGTEIKQNANLCLKQNGKTFSRKINKIVKEAAGKNKRDKLYKQLVEEIDKIPIGEIITVTKISSVMGTEDITNGDLIRDFLDILVCRGFLTKRFKPSGKGGNIYKKPDIIQRCPFIDLKKLKNGSNKWICKNNKYSNYEVDSEDFIRKEDLS